MNLLRLPRVGRELAAGRVSILIPARNEESALPGCLLSAVFTSASEILVYNDESQDATAHIVNSMMLRYDRLHLLNGGHLPDGWVGKVHACQQLAAAATSEWLLFLDAGARISSQGLERLLAEAERRRLTLLTCWPSSQTDSLALRILLPALNFAVLGLAPGMLAYGPCTLVHRATCELLGGHAAFSGDVAADLALMRAWRKNGERAACLDGTGVVTLSRPQGFATAWQILRRNLYLSFPGPLPFFAFLAICATISIAPFVTLNGPAMVLAIAGPLVFAWRFRLPPWSAFLHPIAMFVLLAAAVGSFFHAHSKRGVDWRGRSYRIT